MAPVSSICQGVVEDVRGYNGAGSSATLWTVTGKGRISDNADNDFMVET